MLINVLYYTLKSIAHTHILFRCFFYYWNLIVLLKVYTERTLFANLQCCFVIYIIYVKFVVHYIYFIIKIKIWLLSPVCLFMYSFFCCCCFCIILYINTWSSCSWYKYISLCCYKIIIQKIIKEWHLPRAVKFQWHIHKLFQFQLHIKYFYTY